MGEAKKLGASPEVEYFRRVFRADVAAGGEPELLIDLCSPEVTALFGGEACEETWFAPDCGGGPAYQCGNQAEYLHMHATRGLLFILSEGDELPSIIYSSYSSSSSVGGERSVFNLVVVDTVTGDVVASSADIAGRTLFFFGGGGCCCWRMLALLLSVRCERFLPSFCFLVHL